MTNTPNEPPVGTEYFRKTAVVSTGESKALTPSNSVPLAGRNPFASEEYRRAHENSDVDFDRNSQHHTLGDGQNQAAPGKQTKDGYDKHEIDLINLMGMIHPIGSIFMTVNSANPGTYLGGTWVAWGAGRVPVGVDGTQTEFDTVEETGGAKTHTLTTAEMPSHGHTTSVGINSVNHTHTLSFRAESTAPSSGASWIVKDIDELTPGSGTLYTATTNGVSANHVHSVTVNANGGGGAHNNLQPYITCYMWKRTA